MGEDLAHRYLRRRGCTIVARKHTPRSGAGEIDLVAWHGPTLALVEVKTRTSEEHGEPDPPWTPQSGRASSVPQATTSAAPVSTGSISVST
jgi:putative endonuclease